MMGDYRKDGWPLCPVCSEDELMSIEPLRTFMAGGETVHFRQPEATDRMCCLVCRWTGKVAPREKVAL